MRPSTKSAPPTPCRSWLASDGVATATTEIASKPAPTDMRPSTKSEYPQNPVGAGLPAIASPRPPPKSPASRLLRMCVRPQNPNTPHTLCRSWLASDGVATATTEIASKPAPTDVRSTTKSEHLTHTVGAGLPAIASPRPPPKSPASRLLRKCVRPQNPNTPHTLWELACQRWCRNGHHRNRQQAGSYGYASAHKIRIPPHTL
ncbi:hypothetical protein QF012_004620 [Pseudomonas laurylsulfatiphila]